jgi:serine/threonine-protein kinase
MGTVHLGRLRGAEGFSRVVAIKCLRPEFADDTEHVTMFIDEALMASRIRHSNVVPTLDVCRSGRELWIVMEYIAGESLARLARSGPLPPEIALAIMQDVLAGLEGAHLATDASGVPLGLVHRDVSPQNIIIGVDGVARVVDFGIAKARNRSSVTREGEFKGKIAYAAPEVVQGMPATERADVYATAVTLWEALVGRRLFVGENESTVLYDVLERVPPLVSVAAPHVGTAFDAVLARALAKDPLERFASAREMLDALETCGGCNPAPAGKVARLLETTATDSLRARAEIVRAFEAGQRSDDPRHDGQVDLATRTVVTPLDPAGGQTPSGTVRLLTRPAASPGPVGRSKLVIVAAAAVGVTLLAAGGIGVRLATRTHASAVAPAASSEGPSAPASDPPPPESSVAAAAPLSAAAPPPAASAASPLPSHRRPPVSTSQGRRPAPGASCDPPFTVDAHGDKQYKPECFR